MLKTMTKGACALAVAMTFVGTSAHADFHTIQIDDGAYFPIISYVRRGDDLIFENETDVNHIVNGPNDSWTTGVIPPGGRYIHNLNNHMELTFSGEGVDGEIIVGEFSYEPAPLED